MKFSDIPGHEGVKRVLRSMADTSRLPHALLLQGPEGVGKHMLARAFAQYIHCENPSGGEPCGCCGPCRQHQGWNHIDTFYVFPVLKLDGQSTPPVSDDWRPEFTKFADSNPYLDSEAWALTFPKKNPVPVIYARESDSLNQKLSTTAHASAYKIVVIWQADRMNEECSNKILKLIEEPFHDTIFLLTTSRPEAILPTVYSRCRRIEVARLPDAEVAAGLLAKGLVADDATARTVASLAAGSMLAATRLAADFAEGAPQPPYLELFVDLMRRAYSRDVAGLRRWAEKVTDLGRESELRFMAYCQRMVHDNMMLSGNMPSLAALTPPEADFSRNFARFITMKNAPGMIDSFNRAMTDIAGNANGRIVNFHLALEIAMLLRAKG